MKKETVHEKSQKITDKNFVSGNLIVIYERDFVGLNPNGVLRFSVREKSKNVIYIFFSSTEC